MGKLFAILVIIAIGWYVQNNYDFSNFKEKAIEGLKKEKTINVINSKRAADQEDIYNVTNTGK